MTQITSNLSGNFLLWGYAFHMHCDSYMECDVCHIFTPDLYSKTTLYVHTVTSHCVSCKHVTGKKSAIAKTV